MKLSDELLQEFKERLIKFYSDESLFSMSDSISVESKVNLFGQFMLEKQLEELLNHMISSQSKALEMHNNSMEEYQKNAEKLREDLKEI